MKASRPHLRGSIWWIRYNRDGKRYQESSKSSDRKVADALLAKRIFEATQNIPASTSSTRKLQLRDITKLVRLDYERNGNRSIKRMENAVLHLHEGLGADTLASTITAKRIDEYKEQRRVGEQAKKGTINIEVSMLNRAFRLAQEAEKLTVIPKIKKYRLNNVRKGFFEDGEWLAIMAHLPGHLVAPIKVGYITGWRVHSELLTRQWKHVDLEAGWLRLDPGETKNGEGRGFPLDSHPELLPIFRAQREYVREIEKRTGRIIPWVFVYPNGRRVKDYNGPWKTAARKAGCPNKLVHDLRRTAVRNMERHGVSRSAAMRLTGHLTESVYRRYAIVDEAMLREGVAKLPPLPTALNPPALAIVKSA